MLALLNDIGVPPTDRMALVLAWKLCAETQCEFSWEEFREGMTKLKYVPPPRRLVASTDAKHADVH